MDDESSSSDDVSSTSFQPGEKPSVAGVAGEGVLYLMRKRRENERRKEEIRRRIDRIMGHLVSGEESKDNQDN